MTPDELREGLRPGKHFGTATERCPFCGHEALIKPFRLDGKIAWYYAECQGCGIQGFSSPTARQAREAWDELAKHNFVERPDTPPLDEPLPTWDERMELLRQLPVIKRDKPIFELIEEYRSA